MRRLLVGLVAAGLVFSVAASEVMARGGRGGGRGAAGGARAGGGAAAPARGAGSHAAPGARGPIGATTAGSLGNHGGSAAAGSLGHFNNLNSNHGPAGTHSPSGVRNWQEHLGLSRESAGQLGQNLQHATGEWNPSQYPPFSPAWYAQHPSAFQVTHPYAGEAFAAATAIGLARWLAVPVVVGTASSPEQTVVVEEAAPEEPADQAPAPGTAADGTQWMTVGAFALRSNSQSQPATWVQLAVSREGEVRGSHYDLMSDTAHNLQGRVDKLHRRLSWTVGPTGKVVFAAPLDDLTRPNGTVSVRFPDGKTETLQLAQVSK